MTEAPDFRLHFSNYRSQTECDYSARLLANSRQRAGAIQMGLPVRAGVRLVFRLKPRMVLLRPDRVKRIIHPVYWRTAVSVTEFALS